MDIRKMTVDDYDEVYVLWTACAGMGLRDRDDSKSGIAAFLKRNPDTCFVALKAHKIVGVIMAGNDGRRGYLYHAAVAPWERRQGIAGQLVDTALKALEQCGIRKAALVVFDQNEAGNRFWESQGFTVREDLVYRNKVIAE